MKNPPRILIADRNPHVRAFIQREMIKYGYQVRLARDGRDLFGWIDHAGAVDLLVLDPELPDAEGTHLLEQVCSRCPDLPIVLHTDSEKFSRGQFRQGVVTVGKSGSSIEKLIQVICGMLPVAH